MSKSISVRQARGSDEQRLSHWLALQNNCYSRFSVKSLGNWLSTQNVLVAEDRVGYAGFLLYVPTYREFAAIIGLAVDNFWDVDRVIAVLLDEGASVLHRRGISALNCVTHTEWLLRALAGLGFQCDTRLASYVKEDTDVLESGNTRVAVRELAAEDISGVIEIDAAAFEPMWRQDEHMMLSYLQGNGYLIGAWWQDTLVGYASGIWNGDRGHINRLAVHPREQGWGIGGRLLAESIIRFREHDVRWVTLNTQAGNETSRRLYERFGFHLVDLCTQAFTRRLSL